MKNGKIYIMLVVLLLYATPTDAKLLQPYQYKEGECELVAKEYQKIYGGYLIFVQPLKDNGAWDLGPYNGAFINKAYNKERGIYYIDYMSQSYFKNESEILDWYIWRTNKKAVIFNMNDGGTPFPFIWHY
jgi:hypothetical protein